MSIDEKVKNLIHEDQESALVLIIDEYGKSLKRLAMSILGSSMYADDIVITAIQNLWISIVLEKKEIQNIEGYLFKSVSNLSKKQQKTTKNRIKREKIFVLKSEGDQLETLLEAALVKKNLLEFIINRINSLPLTQETLAIRLAYIDGLSNEDIADVMSITIDHAKKLKSRGMQKLIKLVQKEIEKKV